jgi:hypothetical protein
MTLNSSYIESVVEELLGRRWYVNDRVGYIHDYYDPEAIAVFSDERVYPHAMVVFEPCDDKYIVSAIEIWFSPIEYIYIENDEYNNEENLKKLVNKAREVLNDFLAKS